MYAVVPNLKPKDDCAHQECTTQHLHMLSHGSTVLGDADHEFSEANKEWHRNSQGGLAQLRRVAGGRNIGVVKFTALVERCAVHIDSPHEANPRTSYAEVGHQS